MEHSVSFELQYDDVAAASDHVNGKTPVFLYRFKVGVIIFVIIALFVIRFVNHGVEPFAPFPDLPLVLAVLVFIGASLVLRHQRKNLPKQLEREGITGVRIQATVQEDGFYTESPAGSGLTRWAYVNDIVRTDRHIIVMLSEANECMPIPRRAFSAPSDAEEFYGAALKYWKPGTHGGVV